MEQAPELKEFTIDKIEKQVFSTTLRDSEFNVTSSSDHFPDSEGYVILPHRATNPEVSSREEGLSDPWLLIGVDKKVFIEEDDDISKDAISKLESDPSQVFKYLVKKLLHDLIFFNLQPRRITSLDEDGICLIFDQANRSMYMEIFNDGEISSLVEDRDERLILSLNEYNSVDESFRSIKSFLSNGISS